MSLLNLVGVIPDWVDQAACGPHNNPGVDPEAFFPAPGRNNEGDTREAREICRTCPVNTDCAAYAIANHIEDGIWGGMTDRTRRKISGTPRAGGRYSGLPKTCRRCGDPVTTPRAQFCGDACRDAHNREYARNYQRQQQRRRLQERLQQRRTA